MDRYRFNASLMELCIKAIGAMLGAGEDDGLVDAVLKKVQKGWQFLRTFNKHHFLLNGFSCC